MDSIAFQKKMKCVCENIHLLDVFITQFTNGSKRILPQRHVFFSLRIKGWVFNQTVRKYPHVTLDLKWFDVETTFSCLFLDGSYQFFTNLIDKVVDVRTSLNCIK